MKKKVHASGRNLNDLTPHARLLFLAFNWDAREGPVLVPPLVDAAGQPVPQHINPVAGSLRQELDAALAATAAQPKERHARIVRILRARLGIGLGPDAPVRTLADVAADEGVERERIRQYQALGLRMLRSSRINPGLTERISAACHAYAQVVH